MLALTEHILYIAASVVGHDLAENSRVPSGDEIEVEAVASSVSGCQDKIGTVESIHVKPNFEANHRNGIGVGRGASRIKPAGSIRHMGDVIRAIEVDSVPAAWSIKGYLEMIVRGSRREVRDAIGAESHGDSGRMPDHHS